MVLLRPLSVAKTSYHRIQRQRRSAAKPRVGATKERLPWVNEVMKSDNPNGVAHVQSIMICGSRSRWPCAGGYAIVVRVGPRKRGSNLKQMGTIACLNHYGGLGFKTNCALCCASTKLNGMNVMFGSEIVPSGETTQPRWGCPKS